MQAWVRLILAIGFTVTLGAQDFETYESLTIGATAVGITNTVRDPAGRPQATECVGRLETADVRFRTDSTDPTATEGVLLQVGDIQTLRGHAVIERIKWIRTGGTSGTLKIRCYQRPGA